MAGADLKILVVDDDVAMLRIVTKWLEMAGYEVVTAEDGVSAQDVILNQHPSMVITDWNMPNMNGIELCQWLRSQPLANYVYAIFLTSRDDSCDVVNGLDAGADDFLKKPVDRSELLARVKSGQRVLELECRLSDLAKRDSLTGLYNRRTFHEMLTTEWDRALRHNRPISCVVLDIDFFKRINDTYGHPVGDEVIRYIGRTLMRNCRSSDIVCRYGGEEFCVLLPETGEVEAVQWADRARRVIQDGRIPLSDGSGLQITASFGVTERLDDTRTQDDLVDLADQALLVAKQTGRNRVIRYRSLRESAEIQAEEDGPSAILRNRVARDAMSSVVASLNGDQPVGHASRYFLRFRIASAPVVDNDGKLIGVLSEKDVLAIMLESEWWKTKIKDVMKQNVVSYEENAKLTTIYDFLSRVSIRAVVIVKDDKPVGTISRGALVRWMTNAVASTVVESDIDLREEDVTPDQLLENMLELSGEISYQSSKLDQFLETSTRDIVPCVVGSATRIQELVNDLLSHSRYLNQLEIDPSAAEYVLEPTGAEALDKARVWFPAGCVPNLITEDEPE